MSSYEKAMSEWRAATDDMRFFGEPVRGMDSERLLALAGFLFAENRRLRTENRLLREHSCLWGNDPSGPTYSDECLAGLAGIAGKVPAPPEEVDR